MKLKTMYGSHQFRRAATQAVILGLMLIPLTACSTGSGPSTAESGVYDALDAATGSLEDLNLKRREIPELLKQIVINPYKPPEKITCTAIRQDLAELDLLLGPDVKAKEIEVASNDDGFMSDIQNVELPTANEALESGGHMVHDGVMGIIRSETSFLPFRSIIRRITGAERHQRNFEEAYQAGKIRRAYLKGLAESKFGKRCLQKLAPPLIPKEPSV